MASAIAVATAEVSPVDAATSVAVAPETVARTPAAPAAAAPAQPVAVSNQNQSLRSVRQPATGRSEPVLSFERSERPRRTASLNSRCDTIRKAASFTVPQHQGL